MEPNPTITTTSTSSFSAQAEKELIATAFRKRLRKQPLSASEQAALKRFEKEREERLRWEYYGTIPQKHWKAMSGRQAQIINDQAKRYGIPFDGAVIDLPKVIRALHDFLAANALKLAKDGDPMMAGGDSPALEEYRREQVLMARLKRGEMEGQLIPRDESRMALGRIAAILRNCGELLQRQFGPGALDILNEALDDAEQETDRFFGELEATGKPNVNADSTTAAAPCLPDDVACKQGDTHVVGDGIPPVE